MANMTEFTRILSQIDSGNPDAAEDLLPLVYDELRKLAAAMIANEMPGQTLQATALVHEAYVRLVGSDEKSQWNSRGHFFAAAAEAMRRILVDRARHKKAKRHGGDLIRVDLPADVAEATSHGPDLLEIDRALTMLEEHDPNAAQIVKLRYYVGLSHADAAEAMGISRGTADRLWALARSWLFRRLSK